MNAHVWINGEDIAVICDAHGKPLRFRWGKDMHQVERICNRWRAKGVWWRGERADREYIKLTTTDGLLCVVARDMQRDAWALVCLYD
ncbi:MAG: hypothetical protein J5I90_10490 [Caldilineales bacterium]|nr:hypothetical protein [Caldilineales bacterium]